MKKYIFENGFEVSIDFKKAKIISVKKEEEFIQGDVPFML